MIADLDRFKKLYLEEFDVALTDEEVEKQASLLKRVFVAVYGAPETAKDYEK